MAIDFNAPMTWSEFKELTNTEQHDYLQHLVEEYGANCVSFAQMFHLNANTVRRYIKDNDIGITLTRGRRVNAARWKEFLGETLEETELPAGATPVDRSPTDMQICSASMRFKGRIDVDVIANEIKRVINGNAEGEIEISFSLTTPGHKNNV